MLENDQLMGSIKDPVKMFHIMNKGVRKDTLKKIHMYVETNKNNKINYRNTFSKKVLVVFDKINTYRIT